MIHFQIENEEERSLGYIGNTLKREKECTELVNFRPKTRLEPNDGNTVHSTK